MKWLRSLLFIGLVLAVVLAPCGGVMAGGDDPADAANNDPVDSGHPWDDEANEGAITDPDANPDPDASPQLSTQPISGSLVITAGMPALRTGGSKWLSSAVMYFWQRAFGTRTGFGVRSVYFWR
jgi:hypothetical protein